jgi:predicted transcriptional regulator
MNEGGSYYNTTRVRGQELRIYEIAAQRQEERVLEFFQANPRAELSAEDIGRLVLQGTPRTSWGRSLTNLMKRNLLEKTDRQVEGAWGRPIYLWRLKPKDPVQEGLF